MNVGSLAQTLGLVILVALVIAIAVIAVRRSLLARSGGIDVCWRRNLRPDGRGWVLGQGRFHGEEFLLYRSFSPLPGAARKLHRGTLVLGERRQPVGTEPDLLPVDAVIRRCTDGGSAFELALSEAALTGLRSWLESQPPGARATPGLFHRGIRKT